MSDTTIIRQPAGQRAGGQFAAHQRDDANIALGENWPATPTAEQYERAREAVVRQAAWRAAGTPVTESTDEAVERIAMSLAELEGALIAWKAGLPHQDDAAFEAIWSGETPGFGEDHCRQEIEHLTALRADLAAREITPSSIIGNGYKPAAARRLAEEYIDNGIQQFELALECRGRNLSVNQANVRHRRRAADLAAQPF